MAQFNTVLLVEDHPIILKGLSQLLSAEPGFAIVAEASSCAAALEALKEKRPTVVLVDLTLGDESGLDLIRSIKATSPEVRILVLSMHDERFYAERSLAAGAHGYCMKEEAADIIISALRAVCAGKTWRSPRFMERAGEYDHEQGRLASVKKLSDREFQIFALIGKGLGTVEIAAKLQRSTKTIDAHKENIKQKLCCGSAQDLRQYAVEWQTSQGKG